MPNYLDIPEANPVKFYPEGYTPPVNYLSRYMDAFPFQDQIRDYEEPVYYFQKWFPQDVIKLQFSANYGPMSIDVVNKYGVVKTITPAQVTTGILSQPFTFKEANITLHDIPEDCYYLRLRCGDDYRFSEPFNVGYVANTILLEYTHNENDYGVAFDTGIVFPFRIEAAITNFQPGVESKVYESQNLDIVRLSAVPFRQNKLIIGPPEGVPIWVADKINRIFCCNIVKADGKEWVRPEGSSMERKGEENYPMAGWSMDIREAINRTVQRFEGTVDPTIRSNVYYNLDNPAFGDLTGPPSNTLITIIETE